MTALRRTARWAWPTDRQPATISLWTRFWLRLGLYAAIGIASWGHWWYAVRP